jgi:hypothetical protein
MTRIDENGKILVNEIISFVGLVEEFIWEFLTLLIFAFLHIL